MEIEITDDKSRMDLQWITEKLSSTYWAKGRTIDMVESCVAHSLNIGLIKNGRQIGYARVVTDHTVFAYIMDVFVDETERGKGYGKQLIRSILSHQSLQKISVWRLATTDRHALYSAFGFSNLKNPGNMMELLKNS